MMVRRDDLRNRGNTRAANESAMNRAIGIVSARYFTKHIFYFNINSMMLLVLPPDDELF